MPKITITRKKEWNNRLRQFGLYVDGERIGEIGNGETKTFEVPAGQHQLKARIDWCGSPELTYNLQGDESLVLGLGGLRFGALLLPVVVAIIGVQLFLRTYYAFNSDWLGYLALPVLFYLFYYISLGRNQYLRWIEA